MRLDPISFNELQIQLAVYEILLKSHQEPSVAHVAYKSSILATPPLLLTPPSSSSPYFIG